MSEEFKRIESSKIARCDVDGCIHEDGCPNGCRSPVTLDLFHFGDQIGPKEVNEALLMREKFSDGKEGNLNG